MDTTVQCSAAAAGGSRGVGGKCAFSPTEFTGFRLMSSKFESHDTRRFIFSLAHPDDVMNMPVASCVLVKYTDPESGKDVVRPYTPISTNAQKGHFELLVKRYPKGKMGTHIFSMRPGEELHVKGPFVKFDYKPNTKKHIGMICGGTGITPMYQVIREVVDNPSDKTKLSLIYANNSRKDILLGNELCELQKTYPNFHMYLTLVEPPKRWLGGVGFVTKEILQAFLPKPQEPGTSVFVCGPPGMMKHISGDKDFTGGGAPKQGELAGLLKEMGYKSEQVFKF